MAAPPVITYDFETLPIRRRPEYPPTPVGVAIRWPGEPARYWAFGHPADNNCSEEQAKAEMWRAWTSGLRLLAHNQKFDSAVAQEKWGFPTPPWNRFEDTMFLAFLCDPHEKRLGLKPLSEKWLGLPPEERSELDAWIMAHSEQLLQAYPWNRQTPTQTKITASQCGAWIFATPGDLAGRYAIGDVDRTLGLWEEMWPLVQEHGMGAAYDRERRLLPILMENERIGIRTDVERLETDSRCFSIFLRNVEYWLRETLHTSGLNFDADKDVSAVLLERGVVPADNWQRTAKSGELSMSKENLLPEHFTGPGGAEIASALGYRNRLKTCLTMFMQPWLAQAEQRGGYISTNWNQTRGGEGGTRTGRPSTSDPNLLNVSKSWMGRDDGYVHPAFLGVPELPLCRKYLLPDEDEEFLHRDFDGQEMRVFAHGEQGALNEQFNADPNLDPHAYIGAELNRVAGRSIDRTSVKALNFQGLYGGGVPALQRKLRVSAAEAKQLKTFHDRALPGRTIFNEEIKRQVGRGEPIRTVGGRLYFVEEPGFSKKHNRHMTYDYKLINYWTQGSAADLTKEVLIQWHGAKERSARFLLMVYDEINVSSERGAAAVKQMRLLKEIMEETRLSVPMRSSPKHGPSWGDSKRCPPEKGCPICQ